MALVFSAYAYVISLAIKADIKSDLWFRATLSEEVVLVPDLLDLLDLIARSFRTARLAIMFDRSPTDDREHMRK